MNVTIGGVDYPASFTLLDMRDLGRSGVMAQIRKFATIEEWEQLDILAAFMSACIRRAGGKLTADELLLALRPSEIKGLSEATRNLLGTGGEEANPNAQSPGTTTT